MIEWAHTVLVFFGISVAKNQPANAGNMGLIPQSGRSPEEGNDYSSTLFSFFYLFILIETNYFTILWWFFPYINMNQPPVHMCPHILKLPSSSPHPCTLSQSTSFEYSASCIKLAVVIYFTYGNIHVSVLFPQIIPSSPSPMEFKSLLFTSVSLLMPCI